MLTATLSTPTFDLIGSITLRIEFDSDIARVSSRVTKSPTIDGGNVLSHGGFNPADEDITLRFIPTIEEDTAINRLIELYPILNLATRYGFYSGAIEFYRLDIGTGEATLRFLTLERR